MSLEHTDRDTVVRAAPAHGRVELACAHVLVVDDDAAARAALEALLRAAGFATSSAESGDTALSAVRRTLPDVVLTDLEMPLIGGAELCQRLREIDRDLPVIVMTAHASMQSVIEVLRAGAEDYLLKPLECDAVLWCVERALARRAEKRERVQLYRVLNERLVLSSIREQEHADAEARHRAQLEALLQNLKEGVAIADATGRVLLINAAARAILGAETEEQSLLDTFHSRELLDVQEHPLVHEQRPLIRALRGEQFTDYEVLRVRPDGERRRVLSTGTSVRDEAGNVALAIIVFRDITEMRRLEQQRDEYLALISHDLRNPLSSISMCVSMLRQSTETKARTDPPSLVSKYAERAARNVQRMTLMLDELTESTGLESPGVVLQHRACDLRALIANVVDSLDDTHARRITIDGDQPPSYEVLGDAARLERVVANLLSNALKYSAPESPVIARLARRGSSVELDVIDCGIGIDPDSVRMLFAKYYRTTNGKSQASGLGLGLYIAERIVEAHGGRIEVSSEVGKGSTFRLVLPCRPDQNAEPPFLALATDRPP